MTVAHAGRDRARSHDSTAPIDFPAATACLPPADAGVQSTFDQIRSWPEVTTSCSPVGRVQAAPVFVSVVVNVAAPGNIRVAGFTTTLTSDGEQGAAAFVVGAVVVGVVAVDVTGVVTVGVVVGTALGEVPAVELDVTDGVGVPDDEPPEPSRERTTARTTTATRTSAIETRRHQYVARGRPSCG